MPAPIRAWEVIMNVARETPESQCDQDISLDSENFSQKKVATIDHASEAVTYNHLKVVYF
jgi:hypothetical protein